MPVTKSTWFTRCEGRFPGRRKGMKPVVADRQHAARCVDVFRKEPAHRVMPRNAQDVAEAVRAVRGGGEVLTVQSSGHSVSLSCSRPMGRLSISTIAMPLRSIRFPASCVPGWAFASVLSTPRRLQSPALHAGGVRRAGDADLSRRRRLACQVFGSPIRRGPWPRTPRLPGSAYRPGRKGRRPIARHLGQRRANAPPIR